VQHLRRNAPQRFFSHARKPWRLYVPVQVYVEQFKHNHIVGPKGKAVYHLYYAVSIWIFTQYLLEQASFNLSVDDVLMFVTTNFECHASAVVFHIKGFYYNAESPLIKCTLNEVSVAKLFALLHSVVVVWAINLRARLNPD
jgi:hypothetical protein